jgi:hypothetical protein
MSSAPSPHPDHPLSAELQFQTAEPVTSPSASGLSCVVCKTAIDKTYYHAQGAVVCELCAKRIETGQQAPPALSLARAALYGGGAALAGSILYSLVAIVTGLEIGLIAIVVGVMVGKAVRHGSRGMGGRPQQILAVVLTYFSITTSYIPVFIYQQAKNPTAQQTQKQADTTSAKGAEEAPPAMSIGAALAILVLLAAAAPFFGLSAGFSAVITLFIIFIGLQRAWTLTGRGDILVMGPYEVSPAE